MFIIDWQYRRSQLLELATMALEETRQTRQESRAALDDGYHSGRALMSSIQSRVDRLSRGVAEYRPVLGAELGGTLRSLLDTLERALCELELANQLGSGDECAQMAFFRGGRTLETLCYEFEHHLRLEVRDLKG